MAYILQNSVAAINYGPQLLGQHINPNAHAHTNRTMPVTKHYYSRYQSMDDEDNLAPEKLAELRACFGTFDRNGDGTISASEFQNALIRMNIYIPAEVL